MFKLLYSPYKKRQVLSAKKDRTLQNNGAEISFVWTFVSLDHVRSDVINELDEFHCSGKQKERVPN